MSMWNPPMEGTDGEVFLGKEPVTEGDHITFAASVLTLEVARRKIAARIRTRSIALVLLLTLTILFLHCPTEFHLDL